MVSQFFKKKSKRVPAARRYKVEKWVKEHDRKERKKSRKAMKAGRVHKKNQKLIDVPGKAPFKEEVLREALDYKVQVEKDRQKKREAINAARAKDKTTKKATDLSGLVSNAAAKQAAFQVKASSSAGVSDGTTPLVMKENSLKAYYSEVKKVVESADVVIQVLDARDPLGSRCPQLEKAVLEQGKRLILLLNKIDLVPKENVEEWLKYFRRELPCVGFKASTQEQKTRLGFAGRDASRTSKCVGADVLMRILGNYCRNKDVKTSIRVGIVGFPNVGKSSVINSLRRKASCNVGATPGVTKQAQLVDLDQNIKLVDTPGVVMAQRGDPVDVALRNAVKIETIQDPVTPVEGILRRCSKEMLMMQYNIPEFEDVHEFLSKVAKKLGRLKRGGVANTTAAARSVLTDWNSGKIRYYTQPPEETARSEHISSEIVSTFSQEFNLDSLPGDSFVKYHDDPLVNVSSAVVPTAGPTDGFEENPTVTKVVPRADPGSDEDMEDRTKTAPEDLLDGNQQMNKKKQVRFKKEVKKRKKAGKTADKLASSLDAAMELDDYDFDEHFPQA